MRFLLLTFALLPAPARAATPDFEILCEAPEALDARIQYCSDNELAKASAQSCRAKLVKAIEYGAPELAGAFKAAEPGDISRQQVKFHFSNSDYAQTQAKLDHLIAQTTYNMHLLASYPTVMPDDLGIGLEPVPCYLENAAAVEKDVADLDRKIDELKKAREAAIALRGTTHVRDEQVGSLNADSILALHDYGVGSGTPVPSGVSRAPSSDVTGIEELRRRESPQREILNSFPARDQLTGP